MATVDNLNLIISADSQKAVNSLDELIGRVNRLEAALNRINSNGIANIGKNSKRANPGVGGSGTNNLTKDSGKFSSFFKELTKGSDKAGLSFNRLGDKVFKLASTFGMFYAAAYPFIRLMKSIGKSTESAMDYVETFNYFRVTMNTIARKTGEEAGETFASSYEKRVNELTKKMTGMKIGSYGELLESGDKNLGLDPEQLMNFQARIGAVTTSLGLMADVSVNTQKALSMLSADLSSLTNTDLSEVMNNLQSGLIGQSRALYKYGIDITSATLKNVAFEHGITKSVSAMSQSEKMQLRVLAILDQSRVAWGDQANTLGSVANQYRILKQQIANLSRVIGNLFLPIVQKVLPYINAMVIALRKLLTLFGISLFGNNWLKDINSGISGGVDSMEDFTDAEEDAAAAAKKLKNATMGFDELNIIGDTSASGSGSGGGSDFDLSGDIEDALKEYEDVWNKAFQEAENKAEELANRIVDAFKRGGFEGLGEFIGNSIADALDKINWNHIYATASSWAKNFADFLNGLISPELFGELGKTLAGAINTAILAYKSFWFNFDGVNLGLSIAEAVNGFFAEIRAEDLAKGMNAFVDTIEDALITAIENIDWKLVFGKIGDFIGGLEADTIVFFIGTTVIKKFGKNIGKALMSKITIEKSATLIKKVGQSIGMWLNSAILNGTLGSEVMASLSTVLEIAIPIALVAGAVWFATGGLETIRDEWIPNLKEYVGNLIVSKDEATSFDGEKVEVQVPLSARISQLKFEYQDKLHDIGQGIEEFKNNMKIAWGDFKLNTSTKMTTTQQDIEGWWGSVKEWWGDKKLNLSLNVDSFKEKIELKWNEFKEWWDNTALVQWWESFKQNFSTEKISENIGSFVEGFNPKWSEVESWWNDTVIPSFDEAIENISGKMDEISDKISETLDTIRTDGKEKINALLGGFEGFLNKIISGLNSFIGLLNGMIATAVANINVILAWMKLPPITVTPIATLTPVSIPRLAVGGQVDDGQLFIAREAGPELVGTMNGKTTVANNDQIVAGIQSGVRSAISEVLLPYITDIVEYSRITSQKETSFNITDRDIARANISGQRSLGMTLRTS